MNELALFAGAGGGILGGKLLGWRTICAVEWESYPASVLCARQNEGLLPPFPIWDDIRTFDGRPWRDITQVISGGFPCQDISAAGKGDGLDGERSSMWFEMARVVGEIRPRFVFVENSPMLTSRGGVRVIADLTSLGYDCRWTVMGAADVGAPHQRDRIWIVAKQRHILSHPKHDWNGWGEQQQESFKEENGKATNANLHGCNSQKKGKLGKSTIQTTTRENVDKISGYWSRNSIQMANPSCKNVERQRELTIGIEQEFRNLGNKSWWSIEPAVGRVAHGVAHRVDRLKAIGNGQVPLCAASAWRLLTQGWDVI